MKFHLLGKEYAGKEVGNWCKQIVNDINHRIKELEIPRYKHIVQIMLAEHSGAGCRYVSQVNFISRFGSINLYSKKWCAKENDLKKNTKNATIS